MNLPAKLFKLLFKFSFIRKHYFGFYKRIFKPLALFKEHTAICRYDKDLKVKVNLDDWIQQQIYFFGAWDEPGSAFLKSQLKKNDIFIDVGANIGSYSLIASKLVGDQGKVYAFEPIDDVFERLIYNIKLNDLKNIIVNKQAVYEKAGTLKLFVSDNENMGMSGIFHHDRESGKIEIAEAISLDEFISNTGIERVDMIKIDIEGAELFALKGMIKTISLFKPIILMEVSDEVLLKSSFNSIDVFEFMKELNYTRKGLSEKGIPVDIRVEEKRDYTNCVFLPV